MVYKSDRVARHINTYYYYMMLLEKKGMDLLSATEPIVNDESGLGEVYNTLMLFVAEQERNGILTQEEARNHPWRHILTAALGLDEKPKVDLHSIKILPGDMFLLCTDGLYNMLSDDEILAAIGEIRDKSLYKIGVSLVLKANLAGGADNIAVVLLAFDENGEA